MSKSNQSLSSGLANLRVDDTKDDDKEKKKSNTTDTNETKAVSE